MKKPLYIGLGIIVIVAIASFWYWSSLGNNSAQQLPPETQQTSTSPSQAMGTNGSPNQGNMGATTTTSTPQAPQGDGTTVSQNLILGINVSQTLGNYLTAFNGMTVYTYAPDTNGVSNCTGQCAAFWPPYTVNSASDVNVPATITGKVSTFTRADGKLQVSYKGHPLYFYSKDSATGDTNGQGIGGVWYVVKP